MFLQNAGRENVVLDWQVIKLLLSYCYFQIRSGPTFDQSIIHN